jgi:hypothetical protein|tara:strand:- start:5493 stop:5900 length:408 start_codon:yes stop_codon:yes gene_type:complete
MRVKIVLFILGLFLLSSCAYEQPADNNQGKAMIFIVNNDASNVKTFVVYGEDDLAWLEQTKQERYKQNLRRSIDDYEDEQEEIAFRQKFANVRRIVENDFGQSELITGYDKDLDNPDFEEVGSDYQPKHFNKTYT